MLAFIENFGHEYAESEILLYTFKTKNGMEVSITNYGGTITSIKVPDKNGVVEEITMGFDALQPYIDTHLYFGSLIGRYANRIGQGKLSIDGAKYQLSLNSGKNHLHGGFNGFDKKIWNPILENSRDFSTLKFFYLSRDLEEGYPGNLLTNVTYKIFDNNAIEINFHATTDKPTHVNLTNHCYFNLNGFKRDIMKHLLQVEANHFLPLDKDLVPTGEIRELAGSALDFRKYKAIGEDLAQTDDGYDNCLLINEPTLDEPSISVYDPDSLRKMDIYTTYPGIQLYTSNFLDGSLIGHNGVHLKKHWAFCLEAQHLPDSPNRHNFPSTLLKPGNEYNHTTKMVFSVM